MKLMAKQTHIQNNRAIIYELSLANLLFGFTAFFVGFFSKQAVEVHVVETKSIPVNNSLRGCASTHQLLYDSVQRKGSKLFLPQVQVQNTLLQLQPKSKDAAVLYEYESILKKIGPKGIKVELSNQTKRNSTKQSFFLCGTKNRLYWVENLFLFVNKRILIDSETLRNNPGRVHNASLKISNSLNNKTYYGIGPFVIARNPYIRFFHHTKTGKVASEGLSTCLSLPF